MAFAPRTTNGSKMQTKMSTWTPLNHQQSNDQVFDERKNLLGKWFDKWTDSQRKQILLDLFGRCSTAQLRFVCRNLQNRVPEVALDFTTVLPRVLALYIFSFLDPRSLCRCAQVSWHWRYLIELDQLWMPKCLRFGWWINFSPTPFEQGVWKRHYIEMVRELHVTRPKLVPLSRRGTFGKASRMPGKGLPPWKSSDKHPTDTLRFNYLDNFDPLEQAHQGRNKGEGINPDLSKMEHERKKPPSTITYKLRKAKSLMLLNSSQQMPSRPTWATNESTEYPITKATVKTLAQTTEWNAGIRPGPVRPPVLKMSKKEKKASQHPQRSSPWILACLSVIDAACDISYTQHRCLRASHGKYFHRNMDQIKNNNQALRRVCPPGRLEDYNENANNNNNNRYAYRWHLYRGTQYLHLPFHF
ncbi:F-box only protein 16 isoform X4 [Acipenser ruthenus]|uniref:F-box only protein 16 isoform X4 n=1 Tax=Acipenser ruthenus TaxID=7906 RepID=UPI002741C7EC|nr:F-box only protein 16 isoform X4 [Acipenser ruthenus]